MSRLDDVINQVKESRVGEGRAWIFDEDGTLSDKVIVAEVLDFLNELKEFEIGVSDAWLENILEERRIEWENTYNANANVTNDINYGTLPASDDGVIIIARVHLRGDIRCGYSDFFVVKMESLDNFYNLESAYPSIDIDGRYVADVCLFCESYSVYDTETDSNVGEFYEVEKEDLIKAIKGAEEDED